MSKSVNFNSEVLLNNFSRSEASLLKRNIVSFGEGGSFIEQILPPRASLKRPNSETKVDLIRNMSVRTT